MSSESLPITPTIFAEAIKELPLSAVHAKASELRNSIAHLHRSNNELRSFMAESCESEDDKRELGSYVSENEGVITSMEERILLLKAEVENRGQLWVEAENMADADAGEDQGASATINGAGSDGNALGELGTGTRSVPAPSANADLRNINEQAEENGVYL